MYKIDFVLAEKYAPNGQAIRLSSVGKELLKSSVGVQRLIETLQPFKSIRITLEGVDVTKQFIKEK
jgi:hypothetical protein